MKRSRFLDEWIVARLQKQEAGAKAVDICSKHGLLRI